LADSVQEVIEFDADQIEPPPRMGTRLDTAFIRGMGRRGEGFVMILDIDRVFSAVDLTMVTGAGVSREEALDGADTAA